MSGCNNECEKCTIKDFCGYSVDTLGYEIFKKIVEDHNEQIRAEVIDEFAEEIKSLIYKWFEKGVINTSQIDKMAEQLKERNKC